MVVRKKSFRVGVGSTAITGHKSPDVTSPTNSSSSTVEVNFEVVNAAPSLMYMPRQLEIKVKEVASITTYRLPRYQDGSSNGAAVLPGGLRIRILKILLCARKQDVSTGAIEDNTKRHVDSINK